MQFPILIKDPLPFKKQIIKMWQYNLPGTPPERFEWLNHGNPAGNAIWLFAFEGHSNNIVGTTSIMPKEFYLHGRKLRAGIVGDIMVSSTYRNLGIGLELQKMAINVLSQFGFNFLYVVPNEMSKKLVQRAGFEKFDTLCTLVKPINLSYYLARYTTHFLSRFLSPIISSFMRKMSREGVIIPKSSRFESISPDDESLNRLWKNAVKSKSCTLSNHESQYLKWRYFETPLNRFGLEAYKSAPRGELLAYAVYTINSSKLYIYDLLVLNENDIMIILKRLVDIGRENNCVGIYISLTKQCLLLNKIKSFGFINARNDFEIFMYGDRKVFKSEFCLLSGDRNILE